MHQLIKGKIYHIPKEWNVLNQLEKIQGMSPSSLLREENAWRQLVYTSNVPLIDSDFLSKPPYDYILFYRQSLKRAIFLSITSKLIRLVEEHLAKMLNLISLKAVNIDVDGLVNEIANNPCEFVITALHAKTAGFGAPLKSVSFYGEDITQVSLYYNHKENLQCHMCGLRNISSYSESVRVGSEGQVQCYYRTPKDLIGVEQGLGYIMKLDFLEESVEPKASQTIKGEF